MLENINPPDDAYCLGCGYMLRGLTTMVCPECGRAFDPADVSTYRVGETSWKRVWGRRVAVALLIAAIGFVFCPRDILRAKVMFTCTACGGVVGAERWELKAPPWIGFRYPGRNSETSHYPTPSGLPRVPCSLHLFVAKGKSDMHMGHVTFSYPEAVQGDYGTANGNLLAPHNLDVVLRQLVSPGNNGIGP